MALTEREPSDAQVIPLRPWSSLAAAAGQNEQPMEVISGTSAEPNENSSTTAQTRSDSISSPSQASVDALVATLLADHLPSMFRLAKSIVKDTALAEDVVQESLVKAWLASQSFRGDSSLRSWVLRITHNTAISTLRKRREDYREPSRLPEGTDPLGLTDRQVHGRMMVDELWVALDQLDPISRSITVLREVDGLSYEEIADALQLPLPTVKTRLFRARKLLASALEEWR